MRSGNAVSAAVIRFVPMILLCGIAIAACDSEEEFVCPASGIDTRLVGDWMGVDDDGNLGTLGLKIAADGSC